MTRTLLLVLLLALSVHVSAKKKPIHWKEKATTIDGNISDWNRSVSYYDASSKVRYGLRNDSDNVYIAIFINDPMMRMKALNAGIEIKFRYKNTAKWKPEIYIHPLSKRALGQGRGQGGTNGQGNKATLEERRAYYQLNQPPVELAGFASCNGNIYSKKPERPIEYGFDWDEQGGVVMELKIPFTEFYGKDFKFTDLKGKSMTFSLTLKKMEVPDSQNGGGGVQGRPTVTQGRSPGQINPAGSNYYKIYEAQFFSKKFVFATTAAVTTKPE